MDETDDLRRERIAAGRSPALRPVRLRPSVVEKNCSGLTSEPLIENEIQKAIANAAETIFFGRNVG